MNKFSLRVIVLSLVFLCPLITKGQEEPFDRGIVNNIFVPKGQWITGGSFSYGENSADNYELLVIEDITGTNYSFKVSPYIAYFIKDNLCVGGRFEYRRSMIKVNSASLNISDDLSFDIDNFYNLRHIYSGSLFMRNYISIGESKTFAFFNEVRFTAGGGQGKQMSGTGDDLKGSYQDILEFELGLIPGVTMFITNNVAIEASVNVLGFSYSKYDQTRDQVYQGSLEHSGVDFKINLLSINVGVSFYFDKLSLRRSLNKKR